MVRSLASVGLILLATGALAAPPLGLAQSEKRFHVDRNSTSVEAMAAKPFLVRPGDRVTSGESPVRIDGAAGETVLLGEGSTVEVGEADTLRLQHGEMAVALPEGQRAMTLAVEDLQIASVQAEGAPAGGCAVQKIGPGAVAVLSTGRMIQVKDAEDRSLAMLGDGDSVRLVKGQGGWIPQIPIRPSMDFSPDPTEDQEGSNSKKGGLFGLLKGAGAGGVAAGGAAGTGAVVAGGAIATGGVVGGTIAVSGTVSDQQQNEREESSPVKPTPTEPPPER